NSAPDDPAGTRTVAAARGPPADPPGGAAMKSATATAHSHIALIKYWGKRADAAPELNLPAVGSLSMTVDGLRTVTRVAPADADAFVLDDAAQRGAAADRVFAHLDRVWARGNPSGPRPP